MAKRSYLFDIPFTVKDQESSYYCRIYKLCSFTLIFPTDSLSTEMENTYLKTYSEYIKKTIKERISMKEFGRSCYDEPKWYQSKIKPVVVTNIRPFKNKTGIKDDIPLTQFHTEIVLPTNGYVPLDTE